MKQELNNLFSKPMDRRGFLKHVGIGVVAITGASALVKTLNGVASTSGGGAKRTSGYGASVYGGNRLAK